MLMNFEEDGDDQYTGDRKQNSILKLVAKPGRF